MTGRLEGKVAVVTGAARGIGRACAKRFAEDGADVALFDIGNNVDTVPYKGATQEQLDESADEVRACGRQATVHRVDVTDGAAMRAATDDVIARFDHIDILVTAAGIDSWGTAWELPDAQWQKMIDVNLTGVWQSAKAVCPAMIKQRSGAMIFIGSVLSHRPNQKFAHYTVAKHGVLGLMRSFGLELAPYMVRVNSVDPTVVNTDMVMNQEYLDHMLGQQGASVDDAKQRYLQRSVLPVPWIEPIDVANAALFLASDEARYVTGVSLPIDLGAMLR